MTWLCRWLAICWLALIASTWRLWTPQVAFPQIPFFGWLREAPGWVDWMSLGGIVGGLVGLLVAKRAPGDAPSHGLRSAVLLAVGATTVLVLLNQHRLQPWAYQFAIVAIVIGFTPAGQAASLLRGLTIGIYFWSAVSKFDYTFLHTLGPELLRGLLRAFQIEPKWIRPEVATATAWAFPIDELAITILLTFRRTRTIGLVGAITMHLLLIATLGPWGLNHSWGVLLWNIYFIGQNALLFRRPAEGWGRRGWSVRRFRAWVRELTLTGRIATACVIAAVTLPALEPFGLIDQWPAWVVYAPAGERVHVSISQSMSPGSPQLPEHLRPYFTLWHGPSMPSGSRLDLWSLDSLAVPIYPEDRFSVGVAIAVLERYDLDNSSGISAESRADRFTGSRSSGFHRAGRTAPDEQSPLREYAESFRLNALPRKIGGW